jgi:predicted transcriptional regulator YheO
MAKATIRSKMGAIITVEGTQEEVSNILAAVERASAVRHVKEVISKAKVARKEQKKRMAASDLVVELKEDGFFNKPKSLSEIAQALEEKGHIYPVTTLSGVMLGLVQKRLFGRKKLEGKWVYGK